MRALLILAALLVAAPALAQPAESKKFVTSRPGVTQSFILTEPPQPPIASVILFTGGEGVIGFPGPPPFPRGDNFLVRNRDAFANRGLLVATIEVPTDHPGGYGRFRTTEDHARDVAAVIAALRAKAAVPVWVIGTSRGTTSAVNAAARLTTGGPDGLVITSSIMRTSRANLPTVFDAGLEEVRIPTLVVHNEADTCMVTPAADVHALIGRVRAARKELRLMRGGATGGSGESACGPFAAHGYYGIDAEVVKVIADWITR